MRVRFSDNRSLRRSLRSAIDDATRSLIGMGQLPVTCGLYFSLGHSTIVIAVVSTNFFICTISHDVPVQNVAIAISTSVYDHINGVGDVGGIVGMSTFYSYRDCKT